MVAVEKEEEEPRGVPEWPKDNSRDSFTQQEEQLPATVGTAATFNLLQAIHHSPRSSGQAHQASEALRTGHAYL